MAAQGEGYPLPVFLFFDNFLLFSGIFLWEDYTGFIFKWATALFGKERDNISKRFLSLLLAFVLCMSCLALPAFASDPYGPQESAFSLNRQNYSFDQPSSGSGWSYDGNYTLTLSGVRGK